MAVSFTVGVKPHLAVTPFDYSEALRFVLAACDLAVYQDRSKASGCLAGACVRPRKSLCRLIYRGKYLNQHIHFRQFQAILNHRLCRGYPEPAACILQLRQALYDRPNPCAIGMRQTRHVKNNQRIARRDQPIYFPLQSRAFRSTVYAAPHLERGHSWLQSSFCEVKDHDAARSPPSYGNCRISRTQSPSAEKIEVPHPHGTNEAAFWFTALSASA
jgi:hypothetical protein